VFSIYNYFQTLIFENPYQPKGGWLVIMRCIPLLNMFYHVRELGGRYELYT